jgi:hypothetical protein
MMAKKRMSLLSKKAKATVGKVRAVTRNLPGGFKNLDNKVTVKGKSTRWARAQRIKRARKTRRETGAKVRAGAGSARSRWSK